MHDYVKFNLKYPRFPHTNEIESISNLHLSNRFNINSNPRQKFVLRISRGGK